MTADPPADAAGGEPTERTHSRSLIEAIPDGVFVISLDGTITFVNQSLCNLLGRERQELVGTTVERLVEAGLVEGEACTRFSTAVRDLADGEVQNETLTVEIGQAERRIVDVRVSKHRRDDGPATIVGVVRDATARERRAEEAERKQAILTRLYEIGADATLSFEAKAERILAIGCAYLDLPYGFLTRIEAEEQVMVHTVGKHSLLQSGESAPLEESYCRKTVESDDLVGMQDARSVLGADDLAYELFELGCYIGTKVLVGETLYGTFCFAAPQARDREFTSSEREVIKLLGQWAGYELERRRFEERLEGLHRTAQQLLVAETTTAVAGIALDQGGALFDLPIMAFWEYDADADVLRPLEETEAAVTIVGETPAFERGQGLVWDSFDSGDIRSYDDLAERPGAFNTETNLRSEVHVPCGDHGIITSSATEPGAFDDIDLESLRLLGALVTAALTAVKREERLVARGTALQRQNERLEEFTDVVAHDLRNPLAGAVGAFEIARKSDDPTFFERGEQSLARMDDLIDELLAIARGDREPITESTVSLRQTVQEAWQYLDAPDATLDVADPLGEMQADETRLLQLVGNLFRNSIEHGGTEVTVTVGLLPDDGGFYVADDGPGLSDESRNAVEDMGDPTAVSEIGIGLLSITDVVEAHGWELAAPDGEDGARFEVRTAKPGESTGTETGPR